MAPVAAQTAGADRSPFLPPTVAGGAGDALAGPNGIELRGVMTAAGVTKYNIYDPTKKTSYWVGVNEAADGFVIKNADPDRNSVTLSVGGQLVPLALKESKIAQGFGQSFAATMPVVLNPTPADEQRRLQAVADEVRRRRLLREQAARDRTGTAQDPR
jgi:hypothetical protein